MTDRAAEVRELRLAGVPACYNWQNNRKGPYDDERLLALDRGAALGLRELCALPAFLPALYRLQVRVWLDERLEVDPDPGPLRFPPGRRPVAAAPDRRARRAGRRWGSSGPAAQSLAGLERSGELDLVSVAVLHEDYRSWCFGDGTAATYQEAVPYGAFARVLRGLLGSERVRRVNHPAGYERSVRERVVLGARLRS